VRRLPQRAAVKAPKRHQVVSGYWNTLATHERWCLIRSYLTSADGHWITALDAIPLRHPGKTLATHSQPSELNHQLTDTCDEWTHQVGCVLFAPVDAIERRRLPAFHVPGQSGTTDLARLAGTRSRTLSQAWMASA
jgi:hypothetical protein